ncbi:MAG: hypothetical protein A3F84_08125 [Candidatus Handelsmanbacteria bacterium RIFCSPLOWO2_12_FULL_64_10]|uniref:Uncharacterized protein n=1 Tax=Handelsmanbacteria sp. (strain RIFCSPLOWO2_12_FULL_64_10) TaxID=1817868 RepID=A0A1F6CPB1_HANXR|nr:MAG: hypothetical protein A3F84_08125 [Candidatus Handelsmanbacteria bacterium RIFCSPLOWO2_12_FULL_64_10]
MTTPTLDPRLLELLELHQDLTLRRLADPDPEERDCLTEQMESVRQRMREIEDDNRVPAST